MKRNKSGPVREDLTGWWRNLHHVLQDLIMILLIMQCKLYTSYTILFRIVNKEKWDGQGMRNFGVKSKIHTGLWWGNLKERDHLVELGVDRLSFTGYFWWGNTKERDHLVELGVDRLSFIGYLINITREVGVKWMHVAQDSKNSMVSFWQGNEPLGSLSAEVSRLIRGLPASEKELCSMELVIWRLVKQYQTNNCNMRTSPFLIIGSDSAAFWRESMKNPAMSMACREIGHETADIRRNVKDKWETRLYRTNLFAFLLSGCDFPLEA